MKSVDQLNDNLHDAQFLLYSFAYVLLYCCTKIHSPQTVSPTDSGFTFPLQPKVVEVDTFWL